MSIPSLPGALALGLLLGSAGCAVDPVGEDSACTTTDHGDGTYTLDCPDGTSVTLFGDGYEPPDVTVVDTGEPVPLAPEIIHGDVYIENDRQLEALRGVREIRGDLGVYLETGGVDLSALGTLERVEGGLSIAENPWLTSLHELSSLEHVGGNLFISENPLLVDLQGLEQLQGYRRLVIDDNASLTSLDGLTVSVVVEADIEVSNNPLLTDITALSDVVTLDGDLEIEWNASLTSLQGLHNLTTVKGWASLQGLASLTTLDDLGELVAVEEDLSIEDNAALATVDGLSSLATVEGDLRIRNNPSLCGSDAQALADGLDPAPAEISITGNDDC